MLSLLAHLQASNVSNVAILKGTVIILFLNEMDEGWNCTMKIIAPRCMDEVENRRQKTIPHA